MKIVIIVLQVARRRLSRLLFALNVKSSCAMLVSTPTSKNTLSTQEDMRKVVPYFECVCRRVKITKEHTIKPKDSAPSQLALPLSAAEASELMCAQHPGEQLKLFCDTCDRMTCRDCQLVEHKDHRYFFVEEAGLKVGHYIFASLLP